MNQQTQQNRLFTESQIDQFAGFFNTLQKIHKRLFASGYTIENGQLIPPSKSDKIQK